MNPPSEQSSQTGFEKSDLAKLIFISLPALLPFLLRNYGLDIADSGWSSVIVRDFFTRPEMPGNAAPWFLSFAVGSILTGNHADQIGSLRLFGFLPILLSSWCAWAVFAANRLKSWSVALGVFFAAIAAYATFCASFINYNTISASLALFSFACLIFSGKQPTGRFAGLFLILVAGMLIVFSSASRIANLTMGAPFLYLIWSYHRYNPKAYLVAVAGALLGVVSLWILVRHGGQEPYVINNLREFLGDKGSASHPKFQLFAIYFATFSKTAVQASLLFFLLHLATKKIAGKNTVWNVALLLIGLYCCKKIGMGLAQAVPVLSLFVLLAVSDRDRVGAELKPILIAGFLFCMLFPLGSMNGFANCCFALWLAIPAGLAALGSMRIERLILGGVMVVSSARLSWNAVATPYWDGPAWRLNATLDNETATGIRTTPERKAVLDDIVAAVAKYAKPGDPILAYQNIPMIYMLTRTKPWIPYPWPYIVSPRKIGTAISEQAKTTMPKVIVRERTSCFGNDWPNSDSPPVYSIYSGNEYEPIYAEFIGRYGFKVVHSNKMFDVLVQ